MKLLQINASVNSGSTGRIAEDIGRVVMDHGYESYIAYGRGQRPSSSNLIRIGNDLDVKLHGIKTMLLDRHGFGSKQATKIFIKQVEKIQPDVIGLHNLHGYYLNIEVLFDFLKASNIPVLWTLFDCWAFTGHCTYFDNIQCEKWIKGCHHCPKTRYYPTSYGLDQSKNNYADKKRLFTGLDHMELVVHSNWLKDLVKQSYLKSLPVHCIPSGIDLDVFQPSEPLEVARKKELSGNKKIILGVASIWDPRKGLADFIELSKIISNDYQVVLIGLNEQQIKNLPPDIIGIQRTESTADLAAWYSTATVFINPTWQDNFPTTNLEALACGTSVITYNSGGSPEAVDADTGVVIEKGNVEGLWKAVLELELKNREELKGLCRQRALKFFNKEDRYRDYLGFFEGIINRKIKI